MFLISACGVIPMMGSRNIISQSRNVSGFQRVAISGGGDAEIIQDGTQALTIQTDDNVMPYVTAEVRGDTLRLGLDFGGLRSIMPTRLHFTIHVKDLSGITTSGSWTVTSAAIQAQSLTVAISGSGTVRIDSLQAQALNATVSGSGELDLAGQAARQNITVSGSGKILAGDLKTGSSQIRISGSGEATLWATDLLDVNISGSGNVGYYGSPQVSLSQSGSGKVHSLGAK
jgi:hypothetical protein